RGRPEGTPAKACIETRLLPGLARIEDELMVDVKAREAAEQLSHVAAAARQRLRGGARVDGDPHWRTSSAQMLAAAATAPSPYVRSAIASSAAGAQPVRVSCAKTSICPIPSPARPTTSRKRAGL